jgi:hypothetical protein
MCGASLDRRPVRTPCPLGKEPARHAGGATTRSDPPAASSVARSAVLCLASKTLGPTRDCRHDAIHALPTTEKTETPSGRQSWALFAALLAVTCICHHDYLRSSASRPDEAIHAAAIRLASLGDSPYNHSSYLGTPIFAVALGRLSRLTGLAPLIVLLRAANLIAVALVAFMASARASLPARWRLVLAALLACFAPPLYDAIAAGNLSPVVSTLTLAAVANWRRRPWLSGVALGVGLCIKPYALLLLPLFLFARLDRPTRSRFVFPVSAGVLFASSLLAFPAESLRMFRQNEDFSVSLKSMTFQRSLDALFGFGPPASLVLACVGLAAIFFLRRRRRDDGDLVTFALFADTLGITRIWPHTLAPLLPSLVDMFRARVSQAVAAWHGSRDGRSRGLLKLVNLSLAAILVFTCSTWVAPTIAFPRIPRFVEGLSACLPLAALLILARIAKKEDRPGA